MPEAEDVELIRSIKRGDPRGLELLFRRLYPRLYAYAQKFLHDTNDSEEVVQELFYTIWKHRERLDEKQSLNAYLFTSVRNRCLNLLETKKNRSRHAELLWFMYVQERTDNINSYHTLLAKDLEKDFNTALEHLPHECRRIFELSRFEGLKYQEIATRLNISIKTVETQMSRALSKLRLQLREHLATLVVLLGLYL
ncbi:MAG TPA: RNA polymerase sigma-70 factor [Ohtaekwangia sp.]|uniref:RNA polymerase sigma-70 factor n=1 Tax=Ohtaekwangia sp. TaxID=2066019 RepID=UPI002F939FD6